MTTIDVESYTRGRLSAGDVETQRALDAALQRVRNYCHWNVSPVISDTATIHLHHPDWEGRLGGYFGWLGWPGFDDHHRRHREITLPTLKIVEVTSVTENGVAVDLSTLTIGANTLRKKSGWWSGDVAVSYRHGFTADEAQDFREVVLSLIDQSSMNINTGGSGPMTFNKVDDVEVRWTAGSFDEVFAPRLVPYRRLWAAA